MSKDEAMYEALVAWGRLQWRGFDVRFKDESWLMRTIGKLLFFNKKFMTGYTSTFRSAVYFPSKQWFEAVGHRHAYKVLAHELVHIHDSNREGHVVFGLKYLLPQIAALTALLAIFWSPWFLLALILALPLPSAGRKRAEMRGYAMSMAVNFWRHGSVMQEQKDHIAVKFTGADYYYPWPFRKPVDAEIEGWLDRISSGAILDEEPMFKSVYELMREEGLAGA